MNSTIRYFLGFMLAIGLIVVLIVIIFGGGDDKKVPQTSRTLQSYATTDAQVRLTIDAPVNANSQHQQLQITVDNTHVNYTQFKGYDGETVVSQDYANTVNAYTTFLRSLSYAGFTQGNIDPKLKDERGYCPTGTRYIFELLQDGKSIQRYWSTSCGGTKTFEGKSGLTAGLFESQVPDYRKLSQQYEFEGSSTVF